MGYVFIRAYTITDSGVDFVDEKGATITEETAARAYLVFPEGLLRFDAKRVYAERVGPFVMVRFHGVSNTYAGTLGMTHMICLPVVFDASKMRFLEAKIAAAIDADDFERAEQLCNEYFI